MGRNFIIIFFEESSKSCFGSFVTGLLSFILLLGGFLFSFEWLGRLLSSYLSFPTIIYLVLLSALIFLVSYSAFRKNRKYLDVMSLIAFFTVIIVFIGNRLLDLFSGTQDMRSYFFENILLWIGYVFCCVFIGTAITASICFLSHLIVRKQLKNLK